ncbi:hypothetical protein D3C75_1223980 [compost metagenome]
MVIRPMIASAQKVVRQPSCSPTKVPNGTPTILETVNPANISEIAAPFLSAATMSEATTAPILKKAP